ncbi:MAG: hypothetical protein KAH20_12615, partial [Methylococcales bacterium]|nr:hypothetical protein [Methylococcales bacterium]
TVSSLRLVFKGLSTFGGRFLLIRKEIEVTRLDPPRMKKSAQMKKARFAVRKDNMEKAKEYVESGVKH